MKRVCTPNSTLKIIFFAIHIITKFKVCEQNYFLSNFWVHIFKSVGYRKLANIRKSMQIRMPVVPKKIKKCLSIFWLKWVYHKLYIFQFQIFDTNWPSLLYRDARPAGRVRCLESTIPRTKNRAAKRFNSQVRQNTLPFLAL